ncbi:hypothetical protein Pelo_16437 [Pelomyxa schiedti]|nr:hypothetical protein Pelo_16437 [Pelomyxa schiedti]
MGERQNRNSNIISNSNVGSGDCVFKTTRVTSSAMSGAGAQYYQNVVSPTAFIPSPLPPSLLGFQQPQMQPPQHQPLAVVTFMNGIIPNINRGNNITSTTTNGGNNRNISNDTDIDEGERGEGDVVPAESTVTLSFVYTQVHRPVPQPGTFFRETVWGIGESIDDSVFLILDSECVPVYINRVGRRMLNIPERLPAIRESTIHGVPVFATSTFIETFMPPCERERTYAEWAMFVTVVPTGSIHTYNTLFQTPRGPETVHVTDTPLYDSQSGGNFGVHMVRLVDPARGPYHDLQADPRVEELAEVLQQSLNIH